MAWLKSVQGMVAATLVGIAAIVGGSTQTLAWLDDRYASSAAVKEIRKGQLIQQRDFLKDKKFQIENTVESENRRPTRLEKQRLDEIDQSLRDTESDLQKVKGASP